MRLGLEPKHSPIALLKGVRKPCESALSKTIAPGNYSTLKLHMEVLLVLLGKHEYSFRPNILIPKVRVNQQIKQLF